MSSSELYSSKHLLLAWADSNVLAMREWKPKIHHLDLHRYGHGKMLIIPGPGSEWTCIVDMSTAISRTPVSGSELWEWQGLPLVFLGTDFDRCYRKYQPQCFFLDDCSLRLLPSRGPLLRFSYMQQILWISGLLMHLHQSAQPTLKDRQVMAFGEVKT